MNKAFRAYAVLFALLVIGVALRPADAISTSATTGFSHVSTCAGTPTGTPALVNNDLVHEVWDSTHKRMLVTAGASAAWKQIGVALLDHAVADVAVTNTTTETACYTFSLPGGSLGTDGCLRLRVLGKISTAAAAPGTLTIKAYYGVDAVTLVSATDVQPSVSSADVEILVNLNAANSASSQILRGIYDMGIASTSSASVVTTRGTATQTSSSNLTFKVTVTWSAASSSNVFTAESAWLELLH